MQNKNQKLKIKNLILLILILAAYALGNDWKTYTNTNFINDIVTDDNYLYCATLGGLAIFSRQDSNFIKIFTNVDGMPSNRLKCLLFDRNDILWIGTNLGFALYNKASQSLTRYLDLGSADQNNINCMARAGDTILVGTENGLVVIDTKGTETMDDDIILSRMMPTQISCRVFALGVHNDFWISACPGLVKLNRNLQSYSVILHPFGDSVKAMIVINDTLFIASEQGIARYDGNVFQSVANFSQRYSVFDLKYYDNKFYVATTSGLLQYDYTNLWFVFNEDARAIIEANGLWIGVGGLVWFGGGLRRYVSNDWQSFNTNGLSANIVSSAIIDNQGTIYATHYPVSYKTISRRTTGAYWQPIFDTIANSYVATIDQNNCVWFGHWLLNGGLSCYNPENQSWFAKTWTGLKGVVGAMGIDNNKTVWFHNQNNTIIANTQDSIYEFTVPGLSRPEKHGYEIVFDNDNRGWLCWSGGLVKFEYDSSFNFSAQIFQYNEIVSVAVDVQNNIWCATDQGVAVFKKDSFHIYNTNNSQILSDKVNRIKTDSWGGIWILCSKGLSYYNIFTKQWTNYTSNNSNIIPNYDNDDKFYQSLYLDQDNGDLLIATKEGISQYHFRVSAPPTLKYTKIYPNPFISSRHEVITIDSLPDNAKIKIYDLSGKFITELSTNINYAAVRWSPKSLPSGIYIVIITAGESRQISKFAVVN